MNYDIGKSLTITVNAKNGAVSWSPNQTANSVVREIERRIDSLRLRIRELAKLKQAVAISDRAIEEYSASRISDGSGEQK